MIMNTSLRKLFYSWRFYTISQVEYSECMEKSFVSNNLTGLLQTNVIVVVLAFCFSLFPIVIERGFSRVGVYFTVSAAALLFVFLAWHKSKQYKMNNQVNRLYISGLIVLSYINIMFFGIYLGVFANQEGTASSFLGFIIVALFLFLTSPLFNLSLTFCAVMAFVVCSVLFKVPFYWAFDIVNGLLAAIIGLIFSWQINKYRMSATLASIKLEGERNEYQRQSMVDELTQLKNRRDFMLTFQRYLTSYRSSDEWLCMAMLDIDYFKDYNDCYGHPKGDECLNAFGKALNGIKKNINVYTARIGGEEFAVLWFEKDHAGVKNVVSYIFKAIRDLGILHEKSMVSKYVTVSIGVYMVQCGTSSDILSIYKSADVALYEAKESGRNCAIVTGETFKQYKIKPEDS